MYDFVYGQLSHELDAQVYEGQHVGPLTGLTGFEDSTAVASRLVDAFEALPNRYTLTMRLPDVFAEAFEPGESSIDISRGVVLRTGSELEGVYEASREVGLLGLWAVRNWEAAAPYLQIEFDGFVGKYVTTESHAEATESLFAFLGAAQALGAVRVQRSYANKPAPCPVVLHGRLGAAWVYMETEHTGEAARELVSSLVIEDRGGKLAPQFHRRWLREVLKSIGCLFDAPVKSRSRLLLGCKWLFDSYCGSDQLLQYIQATVVVETLLGDKVTSDKVGLGPF